MFSLQNCKLHPVSFHAYYDHVFLSRFSSRWSIMSVDIHCIIWTIQQHPLSLSIAVSVPNSCLITMPSSPAVVISFVYRRHLPIATARNWSHVPVPMLAIANNADNSVMQWTLRTKRETIVRKYNSSCLLILLPTCTIWPKLQRYDNNIRLSKLSLVHNIVCMRLT